MKTPTLLIVHATRKAARAPLVTASAIAGGSVEVERKSPTDPPAIWEAMIPPRTAIPTDCPAVLIVPSIPDAIPNLPGSTELITELTFAGEKKPCPKPTKMSGTHTFAGEELGPKKERRRKPTALDNIPTEHKTLADARSERVPEIGEEIAMKMGCVSKIKPALMGE